jgi:hypothetical protein
LTTYSIAEAEIVQQVGNVMEAHHTPLSSAEVRVGVLMAYNAEGAAVKSGGYPARASIRVVPHKDRVTKGYDAEMVIDRMEWESMRTEHREALIDHELMHLELKMKKVKGPKGSPPDHAIDRDDQGRPKLKMRNGDWDAGVGFREVVARHGDYAPEFENLTRARSMAEAAKGEGNTN